jgi:hypothetical protein
VVESVVILISPTSSVLSVVITASSATSRSFSCQTMTTDIDTKHRQRQGKNSKEDVDDPSNPGCIIPLHNDIILFPKTNFHTANGMVYLMGVNNHLVKVLYISLYK